MLWVRKQRLGSLWRTTVEQMDISWRTAFSGESTWEQIFLKGVQPLGGTHLETGKVWGVRISKKELFWIDHDHSPQFSISLCSFKFRLGRRIGNKGMKLDLGKGYGWGEGTVLIFFFLFKSNLFGNNLNFPQVKCIIKCVGPVMVPSKWCPCPYTDSSDFFFPLIFFPCPAEKEEGERTWMGVC